MGSDNKDDESWDELDTFFEKRQKEKRKTSLKRGRKIHTAVVGCIWFIFLLLYFYIGFKAEIELVSYGLLGSLLIIGGLFIVIRVYFVGLIWTPLLYILDIIINKTYSKNNAQLSTQEKIDFLWFIVYIVGLAGVAVIYRVFSFFNITNNESIVLLVLNIYLIVLLILIIKKSIQLEKSK